jgi:hypothetical protein
MEKSSTRKQLALQCGHRRSAAFIGLGADSLRVPDSLPGQPAWLGKVYQPFSRPAFSFTLFIAFPGRPARTTTAGPETERFSSYSSQE